MKGIYEYVRAKYEITDKKSVREVIARVRNLERSPYVLMLKTSLSLITVSTLVLRKQLLLPQLLQLLQQERGDQLLLCREELEQH